MISFAAFDAQHRVLYVSATQSFAIWFVPFYNVRVSLVTVLSLRRAVDVWRVERQQDEYQVGEWVRFVLPFMLVSWLVWAAQLLGTAACLVGVGAVGVVRRIVAAVM